MPFSTESTNTAATTNTVSVLSMVLPSTLSQNPVITPTHQDIIPVSITVPITTTAPQSNVIITELPSDTVDKIGGSDDASRKLSNVTTNSLQEPIIERKSSLDSRPLGSPRLNTAKLKENASAPSTLTKIKPEQKTGEVYV